MLDRLAIGSAQFGYGYGLTNDAGKVGDREVREILEFAGSLGINTIDTAVAYGDSEATIGKASQKPWKIVTKLPLVPKDCPNILDWVTGQVHSSLSRLNCNHLYALLLHRPEQLLSETGPALYKSLRFLQAEGLVHKFGISVYNTVEFDKIFQHFHFDIVQAPLNIIDRKLVETGWAKRLNDAGVEIHARSVFLQGLLLLTPEQRPSKFLRWNDIWTEWDRWLTRSGLSPLEACIRYAYNCSEIDKIVVGTESVAQLRAVVAAVDGNLPNLPIFSAQVDDKLINPARWNEL